ncbi:hypothetical protein OG225_41125 (plasmid) [Nocardia sp. NBC_01377]|uniref:hypothetical protein n=1 Tax=Nocardia sp. NBC_01377 TaxID=2903595 RepID=UPI002F90FCBF
MTDVNSDHTDDLLATLNYLSNRELRDFGAPSERYEVSSTVVEVHLDSTFATMSDLLHLALLSKEAQDAPEMEKTLWETDFTFKSVPCTMRHTNFGVTLQVYVADKGDTLGRSIGDEIAKQLRKAVKNIQERIVEPRIAEQRQNNNVEIVNQHNRYQGLFSYFRDRLDEALHVTTSEETSPTSTTPLTTGSPADELAQGLTHLLQGVQSEVASRHEIAYLATALLAGYFSLIQHRLILLTGFSPRAMENDFSVDELLTMEWRKQFAAAMAGRTSPHDQKALTNLSNLARTYRNTLLHGGGGRLADGMYIEWAPGCHSIVTERGEFTDQYMLSQPAVTSDQAEEILAKIGEIEAWFKSLPYFPWINEGLAVNFRRSAVETALRHLRENTVSTYIEYEIEGYDRDLNFEW